MKKQISIVAKLTLVSLAILQNIAYTFSQSGVLDITFGNNGKVVTPINSSNSTIYSIALRDNGKIVAAGKSIFNGVDHFTIIQYNSDGSIDTNFGTSGKEITPIGETSVINSIAIQQDGKIVAGGSSLVTTATSQITYFTIARYKVNGTMDSSFGVNGIVQTQMSGQIAEIKKLLIKSNGNIIAGGRVNLLTFEDIPAVVQYNTNGTIDNSFATNGKFENYIGTFQFVSDMAFTKDEKIIVTGVAKTGNILPDDDDFALFRILPNGLFDNSFGNSGIVYTDFANSSDAPYSIRILQDSSIIVAGYSYSWNPSITKFAAIKYDKNGTIINSFGNNGKITTDINGNTAIARSVAITSDNNFILSGNTFYSNEDFALVKLQSDGSLDNKFGSSGNGIVTTDFLTYKDESFCSIIQPDGKIIIAGHAKDNSKFNFALVRYNYQIFPLRLLSFSAKKEGSINMLTWKTSEEINVSRFEIERSINGVEFQTIGIIRSGLSFYGYKDNSQNSSITYYRLKIVDMDGKFEHSPVRVVTNTDNFVISVFPNPVTNHEMKLHFGGQYGQVQVLLYSMEGKQLFAKTCNSESTSTTLLLPNTIKSGTYLLKIKSLTDQNEIKQLMVIR